MEGLFQQRREKRLPTRQESGFPEKCLGVVLVERPLREMLKLPLLKTRPLFNSLTKATQFGRQGPLGPLSSPQPPEGLICLESPKRT